MESKINTIANTISSKLHSLLPNLTLNPNENNVEELIENSNIDDFCVSAIGVNLDGCHAFVSKSPNVDFNHSVGFVGVAYVMGKKVVIDEKTDVYKSILNNNGNDLAPKCMAIGETLANMGIAIIQVVGELVIMYLPNELSPEQKETINFWIEQYDNLKPLMYLIKCDGKDYSGDDYCGLTATETLNFINHKTVSRSRAIK